MKTLQKLLFLALFYCYSVVKSFVIGIDLSTEFFKVNMLRPGKKPFTMVENIQSKTKTENFISFKDNERTFGWDAVQRKPRFPSQVINYMHVYLGKTLSHSDIKRFLENFFISYDLEEDKERSSISFKVNFNGEARSFTIEEIFGMTFRYIKYLSDRFSQNNIRDCVVTVPAFFGYKEKQALLNAIELSGLNLLSYVNENVAAAVHYFMDKKLNETQNIIFYNMGSSFTQTALVRFSSEVEKSKDSSTERKRIEVLAEAWDDNLGGKNFDLNIAKHLAELFDNSPQRKGKPSVSKNPKIIEKLLPHSIKYKELLSAGKVALVNVLGVDSGMNLDGQITREKFDEISENELSRVNAPIEKVLKSANLTIDDITWVEILGGAVRIPSVQTRMKDLVGNKFGAHMNGDDSMAFGAAFIAANYSSNFRMAQKIELYHGNTYELHIKLRNIHSDNQTVCPEDQEELAFDCVRKLNKSALLYKVRHGYETAKTVSMRHDGDFEVDLFEKFPGEESKLVKTFKISGVQDVLSLLRDDGVTDRPKVHLRFKLHRDGLVSLITDITYDTTLYYQMKTLDDGKVDFGYYRNETKPLTESEINEETQKLNMTEKANKDLIAKKKDIGKTKVKENKKKMQITVVDTAPLPMTREQIEKSKKILDALDKIEEIRIKTIDQKNALETMIYEKNDWFDSDRSKLYSTEEEIEKGQKVLKEVRDWFDEDSYNADLETLIKKHEELKTPFRVVDNRIKKHQNRDREVETFDFKLNKTYHKAKQYLQENPHVEDFFNANFTAEYLSVQTWLNEQVKEQEKSPLNKDPVFTGEMVRERIRMVKKQIKYMRGVPKPAKKNNTEANSGNSANNSTNEASSENTEETDVQNEEEGQKNNTQPESDL